MFHINFFAFDWTFPSWLFQNCYVPNGPLVDKSQEKIKLFLAVVLALDHGVTPAKKHRELVYSEG